jgi:hypothetical protein
MQKPHAQFGGLSIIETRKFCAIKKHSNQSQIFGITAHPKRTPRTVFAIKKKKPPPSTSWEISKKEMKKDATNTPQMMCSI